MKMRRRGLVVTICADSEKDEKRLNHFAKRFNRPLTAGFGHHCLTFDITEEFTALHKVLKGIWGVEEGDRLAERLVKVVKSAYNVKEKG